MTQEKKVYEPLEKGEYKVALKNFEDKKTKKGGRMIAAAFEVTAEGNDKGRLIFHNFNYENASEKVVEISQDQLNKFIEAATNGQDGFNSLGGNYGRLADYQGADLIARIKVEDSESYVDGNGVPQMSKARNKITSFIAL